MTCSIASNSMEHHWRKPGCSANGKPVPMGLSLEHATTPPHVLAHQWSRITRAHPYPTRSCTAALCLRRRSPRTAGRYAEQVTKRRVMRYREHAIGGAEVRSGCRIDQAWHRDDQQCPLACHQDLSAVHKTAGHYCETAANHGYCADQCITKRALGRPWEGFSRMDCLTLRTELVETRACMSEAAPGPLAIRTRLQRPGRKNMRPPSGLWCLAHAVFFAVIRRHPGKFPSPIFFGGLNV